jgi:hypothetical protein
MGALVKSSERGPAGSLFFFFFNFFFFFFCLDERNGNEESVWPQGGDGRVYGAVFFYGKSFDY